MIFFVAFSHCPFYIASHFFSYVLIFLLLFSTSVFHSNKYRIFFNVHFFFAIQNMFTNTSWFEVFVYIPMKIKYEMSIFSIDTIMLTLFIQFIKTSCIYIKDGFSHIFIMKAIYIYTIKWCVHKSIFKKKQEKTGQNHF